MDKGYFDFEKITEQKDELDFKNKIPCPHCKKPIPQDATMCLYCGEEVYSSCKKPKWFVWTAIISIIVFVIFALGRG
ncbi:MAG: hypothetical protein KAJ14_16530 [Candidatus Omnitrophica bacterium]|nr:hypothetical protein [Candidatus Omnitrophota bacterium]MCK5494717.1 hypothetical protein [Candidatus Omnitrophota bacterium]